MREHDLVRVRGLLLSQGFELHPDLRMDCLSDYQRSGRDWVYHSPNGLIIDVSSVILPDYFSVSIPMDEVWARSTFVTLEGVDVPVLSDPDLLLFLILHGSKHRWSRARWVRNITMLVDDMTEEDVAEAGAYARRLGVSKAFQEAMALRHQSDDARNHDVGVFEEFVGHLRMLDRGSMRLRYLFQLAFVPTYGDWIWVRLPRGMRWMYPLLRPLRLALKFSILAGRKALAVFR